MAVSSTSGQGRPKGSRNKTNLKKEAEIAAQGITPLEYMLKTLRDETQEHEARMQAATAAAPYVHPKLATTTHKGDDDAPLKHVHEIKRTVVKP